MFFLLFLLFTAVPVLELYLLFQIGGMIGGWNTILVVLITGVVGAYLARVEGRNILWKIQNTMSRGEMPANELLHGFLVFGGGLLLLTPGFITDVLGLSMVFPVTRLLFVAFLKSYFARQISRGQVKFYSFGDASGFKMDVEERPPMREVHDVIDVDIIEESRTPSDENKD